MRKNFVLMTVLMTALLCAALAVPAARASSGSLSEGVNLCDRGVPVGPSAFNFTVQGPASVALTEDYLNFTVSVVPIHAGYGANATYHVHIYINDGATNWTVDKTLAAKNDKTVWSNASLPIAPTWTVSNHSATIYLELKNASTVSDHYQATFPIYATGIGQAVGDFIPLFVSVAVLLVLVPMFLKVFKKMGKKA